MEYQPSPFVNLGAFISNVFECSCTSIPKPTKVV
jgi:hypothetical protein